jgi:hypothetical protein
MRSRSGRGFLFHLILCAMLSAGVGFGFYFFSLNWFKTHKAEEKAVALRLVDAFVTNYSKLRSQLGADAPIPATFRAHSIDTFNKGVSGSENFSLRWVGRPGKQISTAPSDDVMAKTVESFVGKIEAKPQSTIVPVDGQLRFRTVYPSYAREQSCVDCHNNLQPGLNWKLNDLMGAFAIDVPIGPFLATLVEQSAGLAIALFIGLALV